MASVQIEVLEDEFSTGDQLPPDWPNDVAEFVRKAIAGFVEVDCAGSVAVTLSQTQYDNPRLKLTGVLGANINLILPVSTREWVIWNATTGGSFTVTAKTAAGAGIVVPRGYRSRVMGDGTDILSALPVLANAYTVTNGTTDRTFDADSTTLGEVADVLATLLADMKAAGYLP